MEGIKNYDEFLGVKEPLIYNITRFITIFMLIYALGVHPYSYYMVLKFIVSGLSFYTVFKTLKIKSNFVKILNILVFMFIGILFNPIFTIHLNSHNLWSIVDIATAVLFTLSFRFIRV
jgi:hypothetical protein